MTREPVDLLDALFTGLARGVRLRLWDGRTWPEHVDTVHATIAVHDPRVLAALASADLAALGDAYVAGDLDVEGDLLAVVPVAARLAAKAPLARLRSAVSFHELPGEFFALWLDERRVSSCAYFGRGDESLDAAQVRKLDLVCRKLRLHAGDTLLDVGCGWGALAVHAAQAYGARVLGITFGEQHAAFAREQAARAGVADRCEIRVADFRDVDGTFDRIASIGAIEHVPERLLPEYYARLFSQLVPGGLLLDEGTAALPSTTVALAEAAGFQVLEVESLRAHYARTSREWCARLVAARDEARRVVGETTLRAVLVYLAGLSYTFADGDLGVAQALLARPHAT